MIIDTSNLLSQNVSPPPSSSLSTSSSSSSSYSSNSSSFSSSSHNFQNLLNPMHSQNILYHQQIPTSMLSSDINNNENMQHQVTINTPIISSSLTLTPPGKQKRTVKRNSKNFCFL
jgi:hypothetical protein